MTHNRNIKNKDSRNLELTFNTLILSRNSYGASLANPAPETLFAEVKQPLKKRIFFFGSQIILLQDLSKSKHEIGVMAAKSIVKPESGVCWKVALAVDLVYLKDTFSITLFSRVLPRAGGPPFI